MDDVGFTMARVQRKFGHFFLFFLQLSHGASWNCCVLWLLEVAESTDTLRCHHFRGWEIPELHGGLHGK